jgi:OOP family OmpA-OmpF porin
MKFVQSVPALAIAALLAACNSQGDGAATPDQPTAEVTPDPDKPVSILRPDVEQPVDAGPIQPASLRVTIGFPNGGDGLDEAAIAKLKSVLESEQLAQISWPIILGGHSDAGGNDTMNERVSRQRAETVRDWLVDNGVAKERIEIIAFGEQNPVKPNALYDGSPNEAGRAANRRVELEIPRANVSPEIDIEEAPPSPKAGN